MTIFSLKIINEMKIDVVTDAHPLKCFANLESLIARSNRKREYLISNKTRGVFMFKGNKLLKINSIGKSKAIL